MKTFTIGDIHGAYRALLQVLERSGFDYENDTLICLGDVADGWSEVPLCVDELLKIKNLIFVCGNHDKWAKDGLIHGRFHPMWLSQGGKATVNAYNNLGGIPEPHKEFWENVDNRTYYIDTDNDYLFLHGGYDWHCPLDKQPKKYSNDYSNLYWDRHLWTVACIYEKKMHSLEADQVPKFVNQYDMIFIGHTTTTFDFKHTEPVRALNVWNLDQGAGYEGKLTIMDIETKEYFQSDLVSSLYPEEKGRR